MNGSPLVSIVIPVYNGDNYLTDSINSALDQTYKNVEIIVVDDGSTDNTEAIAQSFGNRIRYLRKENGGVASAVNLGVKEMRGEYFSWLSHDDMYHNNKVEVQVNLMEKNKEAMLCFSNIGVINVDELKHYNEDYLSRYTKEQLENSCFSPIFFTIHGCSILVRKSLIIECGLWDEKLKTTQDSVWLFNAMRGRKSIFVDKPLIDVRIHKEMGQRTINDHIDEFNKMILFFCNALTVEEKIKLCGSEFGFYYMLKWNLIGHSKATYCMNLIEEKLSELKKDNIIEHFARVFRCKNVAIFGVCDYGKLIYDVFEMYGMHIKYFFDNDKTKCGIRYKESVCRHTDYLFENMKDTVIIIGARGHFGVIKQQLYSNGVLNVISYEEAREILYKVSVNLNYWMVNYEMDK